MYVYCVCEYVTSQCVLYFIRSSFAAFCIYVLLYTKQYACMHGKYVLTLRCCNTHHSIQIQRQNIKLCTVKCETCINLMTYVNTLCTYRCDSRSCDREKKRFLNNSYRSQFNLTNIKYSFWRGQDG